MTKGIFIALEGMDCSGKSSNIQYLRELFEDRGYVVITTREPGGTNMAEEVRSSLLKQRKEKVQPLTEVLLFAASRHQHVETFIKPALAEGYVVISDRFTDSSFAYQAKGRGLLKEFRVVEELVLDGFRPDHVLHFKVSLETAMERQRLRTGKNDRLDQESLEFKQKVHDGYIARSNIYVDSYVNIDAEQPIENVKQKLAHWVSSNFEDLSSTPQGKANRLKVWNTIFGYKIFDTDVPSPILEGNPFREVILHEFPVGYEYEDAKKVFNDFFGPLVARRNPLSCEVGQPKYSEDLSLETFSMRIMSINEMNVCMKLMEYHLGPIHKDGRIRITARAQLCGPHAKFAADYLDTLTDTARPMAYRGHRKGTARFTEESVQAQGRSSPLHLIDLKVVTWDLCNLPPKDDEGRPNYKETTCIPGQS